MTTINPFPIRIGIIGESAPGKEVEVRILIGHPMETGFRIGINGTDKIPKNIIEKMVVKINQDILFMADVGTGIAANPLLQFFVTIPASGGVISVEWFDDQGVSRKAEKELISPRS